MAGSDSYAFAGGPANRGPPFWGRAPLFERVGSGVHLQVHLVLKIAVSLSQD
jgi:hypothetical protein